MNPISGQKGFVILGSYEVILEYDHVYGENVSYSKE